MDPGIADDLEELVRRGGVWDHDHLQAVVDRLATAPADDPAAHRLARFLTSLQVRMRMGGISPRLASDIEGIAYPRLWKVIEAIRDGMPPGELRTRVEVMNRRLARLFADEAVSEQ